MLFFLFLVVFNNFFTSPVDNENVRVRIALAIPMLALYYYLKISSVPITVANDAIEMLPLVADKPIKD